MTSLEILATLDNLPTTNKTFYDELSTPRVSTATNSGPAPNETADFPIPTDATEEAPFNNRQDDCEAIPTAVIIDHICTDHVPGTEYREDDGTLSLVPTPADQYGPSDSDFDYDDVGSNSEYDDHASDEDWDPAAKTHGLLQEASTSTPSESARMTVSLHLWHVHAVQVCLSHLTFSI